MVLIDILRYLKVYPLSSNGSPLISGLKRLVIDLLWDPVPALATCPLGTALVLLTHKARSIAQGRGKHDLGSHEACGGFG